jgi:hypothetical protein
MIAELLKGVRDMEESLIYQWAVEVGMEEGGKKRHRKTLLDLGAQRFGQLDATAKTVLNSIEDLERLERMTDRLLDAADWDDLLSTP